MKAIEILMDEHKLILKVLDSLEGFVRRVEENEAVNTGDLIQFAEFFREFADRCHHGKEENILFQEMLQHGFQKDFGPLSVMFDEHDLGREQVIIMRETGQSPDWSDEIHNKAVEAAQRFIELLRNHIYKEDNILYQMAINQLPKSVLEDMTERFHEFDSQKLGTDVQKKLHALGKELVARYS